MRNSSTDNALTKFSLPSGDTRSSGRILNYTSRIDFLNNLSTICSLTLTLSLTKPTSTMKSTDPYLIKRLRDLSRRKNSRTRKNSSSTWDPTFKCGRATSNSCDSFPHGVPKYSLLRLISRQPCPFSTTPSEPLLMLAVSAPTEA